MAHDVQPEMAPTLLKALAASVGIILTLVSVLYHKLTSTDKDQQDQLDQGATEFTQTKVEIAKIVKDIQSNDNTHTLALAAVRDAQSTALVNTRDTIQQDIASLRSWIKNLEAELDEFELKQMKDHESLLLVKDHHARNHGEEIL